MSKSTEKVIDKILAGNADTNIKFSDLCKVLQQFEFHLWTKGSHHIFYKEGIEEIINIQPTKDNKTKPYQVKQVRQLIIKYKLKSA